MAFFIAAGIISNDIVRKETRKGVLTTFRLETGAPRGRKLWIDIECWGHLAGTIAHHGSKGREVNVSGRLTQKTWRDASTGDARQRVVVTASHVDMVHWSDASSELSVPNSVLLRGTVESVLPPRVLQSGTVLRLRVNRGRAGSKTGRLLVDVEHWVPNDSPAIHLDLGDKISSVGSLTFTMESSDPPRRVILDARFLLSTME